MDALPFMQRLAARAKTANSLLCIGLDPHSDMLSAQSPQAVKDFCIRIIDQTHDLACAFKPNSAFFEVFGGAGFDALREVIAYIHRLDPSIPVILDAKRGDIGSTAEAYARAAFDLLNADAITLSPYMGQDAIAPFLGNPAKGAFVLCRTSNPGAEDYQERAMWSVDGEMALYQLVASTVLRNQADDNVGFVVGATSAEPLSRIRRLAPDAWFLVPGIGAQGGDLAEVIHAGIRPDGLGLLINASRSIARASNPRAEATQTRDRIRDLVAARAAMPAPTENQPAKTRIAQALYEAGCVKFGEFTLKSGLKSPFYLDLRRLVATPRLLHAIAHELSALLEGLAPYDHLAAIPYAALPIGVAVSLVTGKSLVYPRREAKEYGTKAIIEGVFQSGDSAVLLDDLATTGDSKFEAIDKLRSGGLIVQDIVVIIDREQGAKSTLEAAGYRFHALITLTELLAALESKGLLSSDKRAEIDAWRAGLDSL